jgi:DNA-binding helix-hairpin-helix protein with protein kinase domain
VQANARKKYEQELRPWKLMVERFQSELAKRRRTRDEAEQRLQAAEADCAAAASRYTTEFAAKQTDLSKLRQRHEDLTYGYAQERQQLQARAQEIQREAFLQQYFISDASIESIGPTRNATLASFGIETAFDVDKDNILQVPGFGEKLSDRLARIIHGANNC